MKLTTSRPRAWSKELSGFGTFCASPISKVTRGSVICVRAYSMKVLEGSIPIIFDARVTLAKVADSEPVPASDVDHRLTIPDTGKLYEQRRQLPAPASHLYFVCFRDFVHMSSVYAICLTIRVRGAVRRGLLNPMVRHSYRSALLSGRSYSRTPGLPVHNDKLAAVLSFL